MVGTRTRMHPFHTHCQTALAAIESQGRYRRFTPLRKQAERFPLYRRADGSEVLVWSSNDYLGMGGHKVVIEAACEAARSMGAGAGGTRNISGTSPWHDALEAELADLHGKPAALLFTSGFVSNQAALSTILNSLPDWHVFSDARNHASMIAGIKGAKATCHIFRHNDLRHLEELLRSVPSAAPKLIAFESVYSMDADISPIAAICDLADRYGRRRISAACPRRYHPQSQTVRACRDVEAPIDCVRIAGVAVGQPYRAAAYRRRGAVQRSQPAAAR